MRTPTDFGVTLTTPIYLLIYHGVNLNDMGVEPGAFQKPLTTHSAVAPIPVLHQSVRDVHGHRKTTAASRILWSFVYCGTSRICWLHMCYAIIVTSTAVLGWCHVRIPDKQGDTGYPVHFFFAPSAPTQMGNKRTSAVPSPCASQERKNH